MCATCGCSETDRVIYTDPATGAQHTEARVPLAADGDGAHGHWHVHADGTAHAHAAQAHPHAHDGAGGHGHEPAHAHEHTHAVRPAAIVSLEQQVLDKNQRLAERNRGWFAGRGILALNLVSAPGSGKTSLLERTLRDLKAELPISVIEGDQATLNDAERIRATGCRVVQINTGTGCHLEAEMLAHGLRQLDPPARSVLLIENVGNLVCPALFDLGERAKVVILSVTEGEDKPLKYPHMFRASEVMIVNKIDLLPHLRFDLKRCIGHAREVSPGIQVFCVSAETGEGMPAWYRFLRTLAAEAINATEAA